MFLIYFFISIVSANTIICTHPQICSDLNLLANTKPSQAPKIKLSQDTQEQLQSNIFIVPPHDLKKENWEMIKEREKLNRRTLHLYLSSKQTKFYKQQGRTPIETIAHYWLYPNLDCEIQNQLKGLLNELNYNFQSEDCQKIQNNITSDYIRLKKAGVERISLNQSLLTMLFNQDIFKVEILKEEKENSLIVLHFSDNTKKTILYNANTARGKDILQLVLKEIP
jgi:hypothetical protein